MFRPGIWSKNNDSPEEIHFSAIDVEENTILIELYSLKIQCGQILIGFIIFNIKKSFDN